METETLKQIEGNIVDVFRERIFPGTVFVSGEKIVKIEPNQNRYAHFILPGFIDAHVHIESTMLTPARLATQIVPRGTIALVTDPHEIANVMGIEGVEYMIGSSQKVPLKCFFGAPSCVPSTPFESSGAVLGSKQVETLLDKPEVYLLSEMMNFPGVVNNDPEVHLKIEAAKKRNLPIDGHAPGLTGEELKRYAGAGVSTDHECSSLSEALEKIECGMKIQVREGSAARNFKALAPLFQSHPNSLMLCTDDIHPAELLQQGHIDRLVRMGLSMNIDLFKLLRAASLNPVLHYNLPVGLLRKNDPADFFVVNNLSDFIVKQSYINGQKVYDEQKGILFESGEERAINKFVKREIHADDLKVKMPENETLMKVIECTDGDLYTGLSFFKPSVDDENVVLTDVGADVLKIVVIDRYRECKPAVGFIKGFELKQGALASSVAHDSHNVVAVGVSDADIVRAVNLVMESGGGMAAVHQMQHAFLPLPVAGLMSLESARAVARQYHAVDELAHQMGSRLAAPFMTLSFMSLLVIPKMKLGDQGLFDVDKFSLTSLFGEE